MKNYKEWYKTLLADLKELTFKGIVITKHSIGLRILEDEDKFGKREYGSKKLENLAKDLSVSKTDLYACIQLARQYPQLSDAVGKLSWREITHKLLPEHRAKAETPPLPNGKFYLILADPPWEYSNVGFYQAAESVYSTMPTQNICVLPIQEICADPCVLFLWVTSPMLPDGLRVMSDWGFEYKASLVWVKNRAPGMGWFFRVKHELLLLGTRGSLQPEFKPESVLEAPISSHSRKPESVFEIMEKMYPFAEIQKPYCELFARRRHSPRWEAWGNEISDGGGQPSGLSGKPT